jgi:leucine dehydrogenase
MNNMNNLATNISEHEIDNVDKIFALARSLNFGDVHVKFDPNTGLQAIVAIHDTTLGPALGGCRLVSYPSAGAALIDVLRLARGMTYKSALANIDQGGGKAVLIKPTKPFQRHAYFEQFGRFVNELNGRYITAVDSGTNVPDMNIIANYTPYVACTDTISGNPAPFTAEGVVHAIKAAVKFQLNRDDLDDLQIAIQGVGSVGLRIAETCHQLGARLTICDTNPSAIEHCVAKMQATVVSSEEIYSVPCDIFSPCALGAVINDKTVQQLQCKMVIGAANNQLQDQKHGEALRQRGILYAPDFAINAGGVIHAAITYHQGSQQAIQEKIAKIYDTTLEIFERAKDKSTNAVALEMAEERLLRKK